MGRGQWSRKNFVGVGSQKLKGNIKVIFSPFVTHRKDLRQISLLCFSLKLLLCFVFFFTV